MLTDCLCRSEKVRLSTFKGWPAAEIVEPKALAAAGLFYRGRDDRVQCAFCRGFLTEWEINDIPYIEHGKHFPDCPFIRKLDVGNVPIDSSSVTPVCAIRFFLLRHIIWH